jgi:hypothetical protein
MPENIRSLLVVIFIAFVVFKFARNPLTAVSQSLQDFDLRRNTWFGVTLLLFLSNNFWIFSIGSSLVLFQSARKDSNPVALAMLLLFAAPLVSAEVSGLGIINYLLDLNYFRIISLCIFLPIALRVRKHKGNKRFGSLTPDKFLIFYIFMQLTRQIWVDSSTNTMRSAFYISTDIILPYYVASRSLKTVSVIRDVLTSFVLASAIAGAIGFFEFIKHWLLYSSVPSALGIEWDLGGYLTRGDNLRAVASTGQAIILGYVMAVAIGLYLYTHNFLPNKRVVMLGFGVLGLGLLSPLSRGPWLGAFLMGVVFIGTGPNAAKDLAKASVLISLVFLAVLATPYGSAIIDHLPFVGTLDSENVVYRERLYTNSMKVISDNLWFGSYNYMNTPEMQELKFSFDGGIIDLVNSYLGITLSGGVTSLFAFLGVFVWIVFNLYKSRLRYKNLDPQVSLLLRSLLATLIGILLIIATASSITLVPIVYWLIAGISVAALQLTSVQEYPAVESNTMPVA